MSYLVIEMLLRLVKPALAALVGLVLYLVLTGLLGNAGTVELALLSWLSGAAVVLLMESGPI
jgi:hypothetical protein